MERDLRGMFGLGGRVAIVTGGASGLGRAISVGFSQFGARVAVVDIDESAAEEVAAALRSAGGEAVAIRCDVAKPEEAQHAVAVAVERFGHVDTLVANAGIGARSPAEDMTFEQWTRVITVNLTGVWLFDQAVGRQMIDKGIKGSIINMASIAGQVGITTGNANYAASKGGVIALTRLLAIEWARHGIRVNGISPTHIRTPLVAKAMEANPETARYFVGNIPLGRLGEPEELVGAAVYLASDASSLVTGHILNVDGGHTAV
jgi:NAD(P)-dependent dehydrogenase (short-subunit alcohol dehydrogenase family)